MQPEQDDAHRRDHDGGTCTGRIVDQAGNRRCEHEYNDKCRWEPVHLHKACWVEASDVEDLDNFKKRKYQYMAKDTEGRDVFLADSGYVLSMAQQDFKNIRFHFTSEF